MPTQPHPITGESAQTESGPSEPGTEIVILAGPESSGLRVDKFLAEAIGTMSRSRVKSLIDEGRVRRGAHIMREPAEAVRTGAVYRLDPPVPVAAQPLPQAIDFDILYEDADLIVLDKPAGLVVHPAPGNQDGTLVNALLAHCGDTLPGIGGERRPGIVHRLDKDTSGVMVVAKTEQALATLSAAFAARDLDRAYLALCWGLPQPSADDIEGAIGRDPKDRKRMAMVRSGGKAALTHYKTLRTWHASVALLECRLSTGRTHQIRVHLASRSHPIVGDPVYLRRIPGAAKLMPEPARSALLDFPRQALHATRLGFSHPRTGVELSFETPPPADMQRLIAGLG
jgi:23S rRNA pseudouridine1911/1915/1917 synthase